MHCKIKKPFFGEPNRSKLKKIQKAKNFYELQNKKITIALMQTNIP